MKRTKAMKTGIISGLMFLTGCSTPPQPLGDNVGSTQQAATGNVVFHTSTQIFSASRGSMSSRRLREIVDDFYPSVCLDDDIDNDRTPDSLDDDSDDREDQHRRDCDSRDGGRRSEGRDAGEDDDFDDNHRCRTCNRGPGTQGDFRLEIRGTEAKLNRGRVLVASPTSLQVPGPNGAVTVLIDAQTEIRRGTPTPGSEIRAEGVLQGAASNRTFLAKRLEVLCQGPAAVPPDAVPPDATPVSPDPADAGAGAGAPWFFDGGGIN